MQIIDPLNDLYDWDSNNICLLGFFPDLKSNTRLEGQLADPDSNIKAKCVLMVCYNTRTV